MNKTIIININGTVFHIEEDAYEVLKVYITNVKRHFINSADSLEITTDIENRIAEMFTQILAAENKQVIVEADVNNVIAQMGSVEDFDAVYDEGAEPAGNFNYNYNTGERRLFRDPDNHLVAGVCAGIANYFDINPLWIRLAFAIITFFAGTGLLIYVILWVVVPKAVTRADRMAMRGQKPDLQGFKVNLQEELNAVRGHFNNLQEEARPLAYKMRDFAGDFGQHLGSFFGGAANVLVKLFGVLVLIICFGLAVTLVVILVMVLGFGQADHVPLFPFSIVEYHHAQWIYITGFVTAFIPVIMIIFVVLSGIFGTRAISRSSASTLLILWILALCTFIYYAAGAAGEFRTDARFSETISLKPSPTNIYHLKLNDIKYLTHDDSVSLDINNNFRNMVIKNDGDDNEPHNTITLNIIMSDVSTPELVEDFIARGADERSALLNARNTSYMFLQKDSVLQFDWRLNRKPNTTWHDQNVDLTLKLPLNAKVVIDQDLSNKLSINNVDVDGCKSINKTENATSATFIVTNDGPQCKVDTVVSAKTIAQADSLRLVRKKQALARLQAQIDSVKKADTVISR